MTRRLKKLISIFFKLANEKGVDQTENDKFKDIMKNVNFDVIKNIIDYIILNGIPINQNGKMVFEDLRSNINLEIEIQIKDLAKIVSVINLVAFYVLNQESPNKNVYIENFHNKYLF